MPDADSGAPVRRATILSVTLKIICFRFLDTLTGWLSIPNKTNIKKSGYWKKQFVLVSTKKILFYDSENDKEDSNPSMVIDLE